MPTPQIAADADGDDGDDGGDGDVDDVVIIDDDDGGGGGGAAGGAIMLRSHDGERRLGPDNITPTVWGLSAPANFMWYGRRCDDCR